MTYLSDDTNWLHGHDIKQMRISGKLRNNVGTGNGMKQRLI